MNNQRQPTKPQQHSNFVIFKIDNAKVNIDVFFQDETLWLTQKQLAELFDKDRSVITKHINNVFKEGELEEKSNVQNLHIANSDKPVKFYNYDESAGTRARKYIPWWAR
ncbi:MAG: virulence protein [Campylobacterota bacterium]|nr:virulence protein [Campylobacterota bacterium]